MQLFYRYFKTDAMVRATFKKDTSEIIFKSKFNRSQRRY